MAFTKKMKCIRVELGEKTSTLILACDVKEGVAGSGPGYRTPATAKSMVTVVSDELEDMAGFVPGHEYVISITKE